MALTKAAIGAAISGGLTVALLAGAIISGGVDVNTSDAEASLPKPSPTAPATPDPEECEASWKMETSDYANNRWFSEGIVEIKEASTPKEAVAAANAWLDAVRKDSSLLAGAAKYFNVIGQDADKTTLTDADGCASSEAIDLVIQLDLKLANARSIIAEDVPIDAYNSGVNDGNVIGDTTPGVGGDRTAIKIILEDGTVIWIIARCGNIATTGPPPVPPGTTDNPPKCPWNPLLPPDSPKCSQPKDAVDDPPKTQGTTPLERDAVQPIAPPAKAKPLNPATPVTENPGTPAPGATPAPVPATPAPSIPEEQKPTPTDPGTPITDPDG